MPKINVLFLPGLPCDARMWQHQLTALADLVEPVVADLTVADSMADLAQAALARMPAGPFAMVGLSMGGYVAFEIMRQAAQRVRGLALLDTTARPDTPEGADNRRRLIQLADTNFPAVLQALLPKLVHPDRLKDDTLTGLITAMAESNGAAAFQRQQTAMLGRPDSRPTLSQIHCPTLLLCGRDDAITPVAVHEEMANAIPNARLHVVEHCGHFAPLEHPHDVNHELRTWLHNLAE